jgi:hypothetical protein
MYFEISVIWTFIEENNIFPMRHVDFSNFKIKFKDSKGLRKIVDILENESKDHTN